MASESESEKRETLADIVAEMRRGTKLPGYWRSCDLNKILEYHADRIEATWKREMTEAEANALAVGGLVEAERQRVVISKKETTTVGNAAALREALEAAHEFVYTACRQNIDVMVKDKHGERVVKSKDVLYKIYSALSAPARQCDVGTAKEQDARFSRFCVNQRSGSCVGCQDAVGGFTVANGIRECALVWAQTPYAAEEGTGK